MEEPEELIIEERGLSPGPIVFELRDLSIEGSKGMGSDQESRALPSCQSEVCLEEVRRHGTISLGVGVVLSLGRLPALQPWLGLAV